MKRPTSKTRTTEDAPTPRRLTNREWNDLLEQQRQREFAREQSKESVFTKPTESIVDSDN